MNQHIGNISLLVNNYDEAIDFFVEKLQFELIEDSSLGVTGTSEANKRWVVISPPGASQTRLLLAKAEGPEQLAAVGNQAGGRVFLFLITDDFWRDYERFRGVGIEFVRGEPREEVYGTVAVFRDLYGNLWDLIEPRQ